MILLIYRGGFAVRRRFVSLRALVQSARSLTAIRRRRSEVSDARDKKIWVFPRLRTTQKIIFRSESPLNQVLHGFSERKMIRF